MRHHAHSSAPSGQHIKQRPDSETLKRLFPYLWQYKWRVLAALMFMVGAKLANVGVPLLLKELIDAMSFKPNDPMAVIVVPASLLLVYGVLRLSASAFTELRELVFAKATQGAARQIALETFQHLHGLSLRFHLERQTGGMTRDIERGVRGIESLISYSLYSIVPTLIEVALVLSILAVKFDVWFAGITLAALALYIVFTISVTEWRTHFRRQANEFDSAAHTKAVDSLLNYETVKYFNNEAFEAARYDKSLEALRRARLKAQTSLSLLNTGQQLIIAVALVGMLWRATQGVVDGRMTLGDLVMINAFMIQLYIPLNFLGVLYREIKQSLTDLDRMFTLLEKEREVADAPNAQTLELSGPPTVRFESVAFAYEATRPILHGISFEIPAGKTVAVVGPSGSGKSTLMNIIGCLDTPTGGSYILNNQDVSRMSDNELAEVRNKEIGFVFQTFNLLPRQSSLENVALPLIYAGYTKSQRTEKAMLALKNVGLENRAHHKPNELSGGQRQRIAIARAILKDPAILILDEATSALDSESERLVQDALDELMKNRTTIIIAHRLATIRNVDKIYVLKNGEIAESGNHEELILKDDGIYANLVKLQVDSMNLVME